MVFYGALDSGTATATTVNTNSLVINDGGNFRVTTNGSSFTRIMRGTVEGLTARQSEPTDATVNFTPARADTGYNVFLNCDSTGSSSIFSVILVSKTTSSFTVRVRKRAADSSTIAVLWTLMDF